MLGSIRLYACSGVFCSILEAMLSYTFHRNLCCHQYYLVSVSAGKKMATSGMHWSHLQESDIHLSSLIGQGSIRQKQAPPRHANNNVHTSETLSIITYQL